jgi:beta-phosphoglucomutase-like phosphatase (HAD superfamily)
METAMMDHIEDPQELEREIERARRLAVAVTDQTTYQRLVQFVEELKQNLQRRLAARRSKEEIRIRARELWEIEGRPPGRDLEFWLQAERELREAENQ